MSCKTTVATMALLAVCSLNANAQTDFFWSFNDLNTGATNSDETWGEVVQKVSA